MTSSEKFRCVLIGETSLLTQCAIILTRRGHEICGVLSNDDGVKAWANKEQIDVCSDKRNFLEFLTRRRCDYLFSIANEHLLTDEILQLPDKLAVNYHDALLPRYAGNYATSWAIMNKETTHGITWHVMTTKVDAGDILKQRQVEINDNETAFTLNAKCYEAAIVSFAELVDELASGTVKSSQQVLKDRSFFARDKRPEASCLISWNRSATDIAALVRALNFENYLNPLGVPKIAIEEDFVVPREVTVLDSPANSAPGTITEISEDSITVNTADYEIVLSKFSTLEGSSRSVSALISKYKLYPGYRLKDLEQSVKDNLTQLYQSSCKNENFWIAALTQLQPLEFSAHLAGRKPVNRTGMGSISLPDEIIGNLRSLYELGNANDILIAAFVIYLARIAENDCFDIGFTREQGQFSKIFTSTVPLRIQLDLSSTFVDTLSSINGQLSSRQEHGTFARDLLWRVPELRSRLRQQPEAFYLPFAVRLTTSEIDAELLPDHALAFVIDESEQRCYWTYSSDVFDADLISKMIRQFGILLSAIAKDPGMAIGQLPLITPEERHQQLVTWNSTQCQYPSDNCVHDLFETQAQRSPQQRAVEYEYDSMTYSELSRKANKLAHHLRKLGVGPEVLVVVCLHRSMNLPVALLAILKAGGAYLPLDPAFPEERLLHIINDSRAKVLLTDRVSKPKFSDSDLKAICVDEEWSDIQSNSDEQPESLATPDNLAYVIYTSGSTGEPKGVGISHRALVNHSASIVKAYDLSTQDRTLQFASISFDVAAEELFTSWAGGATVVLLPERSRRSFPAFLEFLNDKKLTVANLPTSFWQELMSDVSTKDLPSSLRLVVIGNEKASLEGLTRWQRVIGNQIRLINAYGPTETTITASIFEFVGSNENGSNSVPIGRPIANVEMYVLNKALQPVPIGFPGELHIGGAGLARGYLDRPRLTAEKFIPNPFSEFPNARLYRTGDIVRYLPDGQIEFLGRKDRQVKIRGFRIEPSEIEIVLRRNSLVREAAVAERKSESGDNRLVAYVVFRNDAGDESKAEFDEDARVTENATEVLLSAVKTYLREQLPDYMIPSAVVVMDRLPLTAGGKIDYRALPSPSEESFGVGRGIVGPRNATEESLRDIWRDLLKIEQISVTDNFFDLGGHSLLAVRMFSKIERRFGKTLSIATLFKAPTIEKLAECFTDEDKSSNWSCLVPIRVEGNKPPLFCVHAAGGNILFYRDLVQCLEPDQPVYGFQAQGLDGSRPHHSSVEEMAATYISEMRRIQPVGPYFVAGGSFGGLVAFEIAKQLDDLGEPLGIVALFDTYAPGYPKNLPSLSRFQKAFYRITLRLENHLGNLAASDWRGRLAYLKTRTVKARVMGIRACRKSFDGLKRKLQISPPNALPTRLQQTEEAVRRCSDHYDPKPYAGRVILFRAKKQPRGIYPETDLGWGRFVTGNIEIYEVPGIHGSILTEPRVRVLAKKLSECLRMAPTRSTSLVLSPRITQQSESETAAAVA